MSSIIAAAGSGLIRELYRGDVRSSPLGKDEDYVFITGSSYILYSDVNLTSYFADNKFSTYWPPLILLVDLYSQALLTMGDDEFFSVASGTSSPRNPMTLDELTAFSRQLMNIALSLYMRNDQVYTQERPIDFLPMGWEQVREKITKCLQAIHARE